MWSVSHKQSTQTISNIVDPICSIALQSSQCLQIARYSIVLHIDHDVANFIHRVAYQIARYIIMNALSQMILAYHNWFEEKVNNVSW